MPLCASPSLPSVPTSVPSRPAPVPAAPCTPHEACRKLLLCSEPQFLICRMGMILPASCRWEAPVGVGRRIVVQTISRKREGGPGAGRVGRLVETLKAKAGCFCPQTSTSMCPACSRPPPPRTRSAIGRPLRSFQPLPCRPQPQPRLLPRPQCLPRKGKDSQV